MLRLLGRALRLLRGRLLPRLRAWLGRLWNEPALCITLPTALHLRSWLARRRRGR